MISRRGFLKGAAAAACVLGLGGLAPKAGATAAVAMGSGEKLLHLHHIHTDERLTTRYCVDGCYIDGELDRLNHLLRCFYSNTVKAIDVKVIDLLCAIQEKLAPGREIAIISGYRSPEYNEHLRRLGRHVAAGSLHMAGLAIDFAIGGVGMGELCRTAKLFAAGGVGKYPDFVHIDVGRVRYW